MNLNFSEPMSANFTCKHVDISFSDVRQKNLIQRLLKKLDFHSSYEATLNGDWKW